jgi:hypothetical protein
MMAAMSSRSVTFAFDAVNLPIYRSAVHVVKHTFKSTLTLDQMIGEGAGAKLMATSPIVVTKLTTLPA